MCPTLTDWIDIEHILEYFIVTKVHDMVLVPTKQKNDPPRVALSIALPSLIAFNIAPRYKTNCAYSGQHLSTCTSLQSRQTGEGSLTDTFPPLTYTRFHNIKNKIAI